MAPHGLILAADNPEGNPYLWLVRKGHGVVNLTNSGRQINISQRELLEIKSIYESVMNLAANGLFFRAGQVLGRCVADRAEDMGGNGAHHGCW